MGHINLQSELEIGREHLQKFGDLPTGHELGGAYWDWVKSHYDNALETGHLARFKHYHPGFVPLLNIDHKHHLPHPPPPVPPMPPPGPPTRHPARPTSARHPARRHTWRLHQGF